MALPPLTVRNLTSTPLELRRIERFEAAGAHGHGQGGFANITRTFSGLMSNVTAPSSLQLASKAESFLEQDVTIPVLPFESRHTDIQVQPQEVLRLTFERDGQRYRVDTPISTPASTVLTSLSPDPRAEITAIYHAASSHLALFSSANLASWMSKLKNEVPLSALSIPGTHNSPTHHTALPSVRCQAVGVKTQLENGIRFLDIRVQPERPDDPSHDGLILVHSVFPISLTGTKYLRHLLNHVYQFLETHPSETVVMSLKREGLGKATDQQLSKILFDHYADERWFTENRIPALGEARSKVVLVRRFALDDSLRAKNGGTGWAIDAESWPDNCADGMCASGEIRIQDFYEISATENIGKKILYSTEQLTRAAQCVCVLPEGMDAASMAAAKQPFFMNFLSASNFFSPNCWPDKIAAKINPSIVDYLCRSHNHLPASETPETGKEVDGKGDGSTGIVVCDWVGLNDDWDLIRCIVGMNTKLEIR